MSNQPPTFSAPRPPGGGVKDPAMNTSKVPTKQRTVTLIVAGLLLAVVAAALVLLGTSPEAKDTYVLKAQRTIPSLSVLNADLFEAVAVTEEQVPEGAITGSSSKDAFKAADLEGKITQYPIAGGRFLLESDLTTETFKLEGRLAPNERLVSVPASYAYSVAGGIRPGDRVDVYGIGAVNGSGIAQLMVTDAEVAGVSLAEDQINSIVSQQVADAQEGNDTTAAEVLPGEPIPGVYTLRVNASVAARLAIVAEEGRLFLTYRGAEGADAASPGADLISALCENPARADNEPFVSDQPASFPAACGPAADAGF